MQPPLLTKFGFRIRTRVGLVVNNLLIPGRDAAEAERKLLQIYHGCVILERTFHRPNSKSGPLTSYYADTVSTTTR